MRLATITFQANPEAIPFLAASVVSAVVAGMAWRRGGSPGGPALMAMMAGEAGWASFEAAELLIVDLPVKRLCFMLRAGAAVATILGLMAFVLRFTGQDRWLTARRFAPLAAPAVLPLALAWTSPLHGLYWEVLRSRTFEQSYGAFAIAVPEYGPAFWFHFGYCYLLLAIAAVLLADAVANSEGIYRAQAGVMLFGVLLPWVVNILDMGRVFGFIHVDTVAIAFLVTGLAMLPAFQRFHLLDLRPVAREVVIRGMADPVVVIEPAGRIVELNPAAAALAGAEAAGMIGREAASAFSRWTALASLLEEVQQLEGRAVELDGPAADPGRRFEARASRLDERSRTAGWVVVLRDVTQRRLAEDERAARIEAEASDRAKDDFLAVLSHELRNPLTPVLAGADALLDDPATPWHMRPTLAMIRRNAELEARLIDDLLDLTRIRHGRLAVRPEVIDAHVPIRDALEVCEADLRSKSIQLDVALEADRRFVAFDPVRLQQVAWNLVKNAVKFTPEGGRITVRTRELLPGPRLDGLPWLELEVADTGIGIDPDLIPRVFDAFEQGGPETARRYGGLGLGLAICRAIVDAHGGRIAASSAGRGLGTTFRVELPTCPAPVGIDLPPAAPAAAAPSRRDRIRILLVEDDADTRGIVARLLRRQGFGVETAGDVRSAIELAIGADFDVLVSDLGLPDGSGLDLIRSLRARRSDLVGIAMSGYGMDEDLRRSQEFGFNAHLTKPLMIGALTAEILRLVPPPPPS
ncbi:histidine kinase N-terminal 7TM domain-containing protein [Tautonia sociabilis]|uniref:histidine kinase n=1 Tax=Tautonia sociabilis TaxID=2080755 RepID=A0A432MJ96_9BACT|nr:histidine kinase N-terminal 7TM domain-containing protein [Tautonia sociabilis]RUL87441.1 response regulator [Tautonia sociabilis]